MPSFYCKSPSIFLPTEVLSARAKNAVLTDVCKLIADHSKNRNMTIHAIRHVIRADEVRNFDAA